MENHWPGTPIIIMVAVLAVTVLGIALVVYRKRWSLRLREQTFPLLNKKEASADSIQ